MTKLWNVAVVGAGIGRIQITEGYNALPAKFRLLAPCDVDPKRLHVVSEQFSNARATVSVGCGLGSLTRISWQN